tara:strand:- start:691 stop:840 length:150 start_codon:yes stop_codon:yes gene_type:complete
MVIKVKDEFNDEEMEEHFYSQEFREDLLDNDIIDSAEEGFMQGYENAYD